MSNSVKAIMEHSAKVLNGAILSVFEMYKSKVYFSDRSIEINNSYKQVQVLFYLLKSFI